jgi:hypothetical protein
MTIKDLTLGTEFRLACKCLLRVDFFDGYDCDAECHLVQGHCDKHLREAKRRGGSIGLYYHTNVMTGLEEALVNSFLL